MLLHSISWSLYGYASSCGCVYSFSFTIPLLLQLLLLPLLLDASLFQLVVMLEQNLGNPSYYLVHSDCHNQFLMWAFEIVCIVLFDVTLEQMIFLVLAKEVHGSRLGLFVACCNSEDELKESDHQCRSTFYPSK